jgi:hypothetical protein
MTLSAIYLTLSHHPTVTVYQDLISIKLVSAYSSDMGGLFHMYIEPFIDIGQGVRLCCLSKGGCEGVRV